MKSALFFAVLMLISGVALCSPMEPPVWKKSHQISPHKLQSIINTSGQYRALIDGRELVEGDIHRGFRVQQISSEYALLVNKSQKLVLRLVEASIKSAPR